MRDRFVLLCDPDYEEEFYCSVCAFYDEQAEYSFKWDNFLPFSYVAPFVEIMNKLNEQNDELKKANEELKKANEELKKSNEELRKISEQNVSQG